MLRIEVDIMSGRSNPEWIVTDPDVTMDLLSAVGEARGAAAKIGTGYVGLGYRELRVSTIGDDVKAGRKRQQGPVENDSTWGRMLTGSGPSFHDSWRGRGSPFRRRCSA